MAVDSGVTGVSVLSVSGVWVMTVAELKEELEVRGEGKSGNFEFKSWLRRRLPWRRFCAATSPPVATASNFFRAVGLWRPIKLLLSF